MRALPWPDHLLTLDEWIALPEGSPFWLELVEGVLIVAPRPRTLHQRAVTRLAYLVEQQLPDRFAASAQVELVIADKPLPTVRVPDVVVVDTAFAMANPARCAAGDVRLVIEASCEGSVRTDRVAKLAEYAEVGI
ncbi:MAG TPA: Uma2 family endonuclease, partial [Pseudonocardiaceae bacterium]